MQLMLQESAPERERREREEREKETERNRKKQKKKKKLGEREIALPVKDTRRNTVFLSTPIPRARWPPVLTEKWCAL